MFQSQHGTLPMDPGLIEQYTSELSSYNDKLMLAIIALRGALPSKCKLLKAKLQNQCNLEQNLYLDPLASATKVLQNYVGTKGVSTFPKEGKEGMSFYQSKDR